MIILNRYIIWIVFNVITLNWASAECQCQSSVCPVSSYFSSPEVALLSSSSYAGAAYPCVGMKLSCHSVFELESSSTGPDIGGSSCLNYVWLVYIKFPLSLTFIPPLERHWFSELVHPVPLVLLFLDIIISHSCLCISFSWPLSSSCKHCTTQNHTNNSNIYSSMGMLHMAVACLLCLFLLLIHIHCVFLQLFV